MGKVLTAGGSGLSQLIHFNSDLKNDFFCHDSPQKRLGKRLWKDNSGRRKKYWKQSRNIKGLHREKGKQAAYLSVVSFAITDGQSQCRVWLMQYNTQAFLLFRREIN